MKYLLPLIFLSTVALAETPQDFGAACNGDRDDSHELELAFRSGKPLSISGVCRITRLITVPQVNGATKMVRITGYGGKILLDSPTAMIRFDFAWQPSPFDGNASGVVIRDLTFSPNSVNFYSRAVEFYGPAGSIGSSQPMVEWSNSHVIPWQPGKFTAGALLLHDIRNSNINNSVFIGLYGDFFGEGITIKPSVGSAPVDIRITNSQVFWFDNGIGLGNSGATNGANDWQGAYLVDNTIVAVRRGIIATTSDGFAEMLTIRGNHINFGELGIVVDDVHKYFIDSNMLIQGFNTGANVATGIAVKSTKATTPYGKITNNHVNFDPHPHLAARIGYNLIKEGPGLFKSVFDGNSASSSSHPWFIPSGVVMGNTNHAN